MSLYNQVREISGWGSGNKKARTGLPDRAFLLIKKWFSLFVSKTSYFNCTQAFRSLFNRELYFFAFFQSLIRA